MCGGLFGGGGGGNNGLSQLLAISAVNNANAANQARQAAAASIAQANLDTESSRVAAESRIRRANMAQGFMSSIMGGGANMGAGQPGAKMLFGQ